MVTKMAKASSIFSIGDDEVEALEEDFLLDFDDIEEARQPQNDDFKNQQVKKSDRDAKVDAKFNFKAISNVNSFSKQKTESNTGTQNGFVSQLQSKSKLRLPGRNSAAAASFQFQNPSNASVNRRKYLSSLGNLCDNTAGDLSSKNVSQFSSSNKGSGVHRLEIKSTSQTTMPTPLNSRVPQPREGQENLCSIQKESGSSSLREGRNLSSHQVQAAIRKQDSVNGFQKYQPSSHQTQPSVQDSNKSSADFPAACKSGNHVKSPGKTEDQTCLPGSTDKNAVTKMPILQKQVTMTVNMNGQSSASPRTTSGGQFKKISHVTPRTDSNAIYPSNFTTGSIMNPAQKADSKRDNSHLSKPEFSGESHSTTRDTPSSYKPGLRAITGVNSTQLSTDQFQERNSVEPSPTAAPLAGPISHGPSTFIPAVKPSTPSNNAPFSQFQKKNAVGMNRTHTPPRHPGASGWNSPKPPNGSPYQGQRYNGSTRMRTPQVSPGNQFPSPQAPVFTPRVAQLCKTPTGPGKGHTTRSSRKFPGPAGILPKLAPGQNLSKINLSPPLEEETGKKEKEDTNLSSQDSTFDDFSQGAWTTMKAEMEFDDKDSKSILAQHNIASVLRRASMRQLQKNKVPHICVMIKLITIHANDAAVTFKDPTGEMQGTLHRQLLEEYQSDLKPGCVLLLKQVGVLSPSLRNHYLNVTHRNVVQIFPSQHISSQKSPTSQPSKRSSPKSIPVNKDDLEGRPASPESSESRVKFFPERGQENIEGKGRNSSHFVSKTDDVAISLKEREPHVTSGVFQKKRTSDEAIDNKTKRQCLENVGGNETQKENVYPKDEGRESWTDASPVVNVIPSEESIAELIDGFEEELLADF